MVETWQRGLAKELAPLIAEELRLLGGTDVRTVLPNDDYDDGTCSAYVAGFGDSLLNNVEAFFTKLATDGEVNSIELAKLMGVDRPAILPFVLTTHLKRRAKALRLAEWPWEPDVGQDNRTIWRDRHGIAKRMLDAIKKEKARRPALAA